GWRGTGASLAALEHATGATAAVVGRPRAPLFETALERLGGSRALVVGDRLDADLGGARAAGLDCAIVLTGATSHQYALAAEDPRPVAVSADLATLVLGEA